MLSRSPTKIELNIEEENIEFEQMKNIRVHNPFEFERMYQSNDILQLIPNYGMQINLNNSNINDNILNPNDFNPYEFNFQDIKNDVEISKLDNECSAKKVNLRNITIKDKVLINKSK